MAQHPERIENLVERSSFGEPGARRARSRVPDATARALLQRVQTAHTLAATAGTYRSTSRGAGSGQFRRARGTGRS